MVLSKYSLYVISFSSIQLLSKLSELFLSHKICHAKYITKWSEKRVKINQQD